MDGTTTAHVRVIPSFHNASDDTMACPERGSSVLCEFYLIMSAIEVSRTDCQEFSNRLPTLLLGQSRRTRRTSRSSSLKKTFPLPASKDREVVGSSLGKIGNLFAGIAARLVVC